MTIHKFEAIQTPISLNYLKCWQSCEAVWLECSLLFLIFLISVKITLMEAIQ